ncbi:MAG: TetR/AcrR family transcriptional regulator [Eubacterium sp.]|nr:TetR/AcrR family transcriptional regulator [Eubacterium sp.]
MARGFSEQEKENIRKKLIEACKQCWTKYGYKKTNVDELCKYAGISKGAFYLFYKTKESLFCEVLCFVQNQICENATRVMETKKGKEGVREVLKQIYREYDENNFLYNSEGTDFVVLLNKLSEEEVKKIEKSNQQCRQIFLEKSHLKFKVSEEIGMSVIYSLIMNIKNKDFLPYNHIETFDFMVDCLIDKLYE